MNYIAPSNTILVKEISPASFNALTDGIDYFTELKDILIASPYADAIG